MRVSRCIVLVYVAALLVYSGCRKADEPAYFPDVGSVGPTTEGKGVNESCGTSADCRPGLTCEAKGVCEPSGSQSTDQPCVITAECSEGNYCEAMARRCFEPNSLFVGGACESDDDCNSLPGSQIACVEKAKIAENPFIDLPFGSECKPAGSAENNAGCTSDAQCQAGLFCDYVGAFKGVCRPGGSNDWGEICSNTSDCYAGLVCSDNNQCISLYTANMKSKWQGETCATGSEQPTAHFEIPTNGIAPNDFFRLPYPNDIRLDNGQLATNHPTAGTGNFSFDVTKRYIDAINENMTAWGTIPTVTFRFSHNMDYSTIATGAVSETKEVGKDGRNLLFLNITKGAEQYGKDIGYVWSASSAGGKYLCENWLTVRPGTGSPLTPGATYAVMMFKGIEAGDNKGAYEADADFQAVMAKDAPTDERLSAAWTRYAPLRVYLSEQGVSTNDLLTATVFTVAPESKVLEKGRAVIRSVAAPKITAVTLCAPGVKSPCEFDDPTRACSDSGAFHEVHAKITLPIFQKGTPPYLDVEDGGDISLKGDMPQGVTTQNVCMALTIPKSVGMPATGWPVTIFAHDTGGSFRSAAQSGLATTLATGANSATLTIDAVVHGPRRGESKYDSTVLAQNYGNPKALRGNRQQNVLDHFSIIRVIETLATDMGLTVATKLNPGKIAFIGQGHGATTGVLLAAHEPTLRAVVLSSAGAGEGEYLANQSEPINVVYGTKRAIRESPSTTHPVVNLIQHYMNPAEPVNYAKQLTQNPPPEGFAPRNVLVVYGQDNRRTPGAATRALADVLGLNIVAPAVDTDDGSTFGGYENAESPDDDRVIDAPVSGNAGVTESPATLGMVTFASEKGAGDQVLFENDGAKAVVAHFLKTFFEKGVAEIPASK